MKKFILGLLIFLLIGLLFIYKSGSLNRNLSSMETSERTSSIGSENTINSTTVSKNNEKVVLENNDLAEHRSKLSIGFISDNRQLYFTDSSSIREYLENEFDFNFEDVNCDFTFTYLSKGGSFIYDENVDIIFTNVALDYIYDDVVADYSLKKLYDAGYNLRNFDYYFDGKEKMFTGFYNSLKKLTKDKIYFYPALICPDRNNESLFVSACDDENSKKEPIMNMEQFYNDDYYFIKRGGPANNYRFTKNGEYTISANSQIFTVSSFFRQTVYVTSDNKDIDVFLDLVFDSDRLQKQYSHKLKIKGNQIELFVPSFVVDHLSDIFDEVLLNNVTYDIDSIYNSKDVRITYIAEDIDIDKVIVKE